MTTEFKRPIRSYVRRNGHITPGQERALQQDWPHLRLALGDTAIDWAAQFGRDAPRVLEIGFGMGDVLMHAVESKPDWDFIGVEIHPPGVGRCLLKAHLSNFTNLKICQADVMQILPLIPTASLDQVWLFFPDPWPKTRHNKRRIVQNVFVEQIARILKPNGIFHLATDWQPYADHMLTVLNECTLLSNCFGDNQFAPAEVVARPKTKFERRGEKLGHAIFDLFFKRTSV